MLTQERLKYLLNYDASTGVFTRRVSVGARWKVGNIAGAKDNGIIRVRIDGQKINAARLAWLWMYGELPSGRIDYLDGNTLNNSIANIRHTAPNRGTLTQDRLKELLHYDPLTGIFTRVVNRHNGTTIGAVAGHLDRKGYITIVVDRALYKAHRLAFLYVDGEFPPNLVDHINRQKDCNIFANLRLATNQQNIMNSGARNGNPSGRRCVNKHGKKWRTLCELNGVRHYLGTFKTIEEASAVYEEFAKKHHGEFYYDQTQVKPVGTPVAE